ncbi:MAG: helix-turn-helix domain-containing protein [Pseudomonadota bacterium]
MSGSATGASIKRLRDRKAWTQERLAAAAEISVRTVQRAEEGTLSAETLTAIAGAFGVDVETLSPPASPNLPTISPVLYYDDPSALDWLCRAFGFEIAMRIPGPDGKILHAELILDGARIMIGQPVPAQCWDTPKRAGVRTQSLYVMVDDPDAHCAGARHAGAVILVEPEDIHGQRRYLAEDCEGHHWWFAAMTTT